MFEVSYLFVLALSAMPIALTLLNANRDKRVAFVRRLYRDAAYIAIAAFGIIGLETALSISLEHYWFEELAQGYRFWLSIEYRVEVLLAVLLVAGLFIGANLRMLCRSLPIVPASAPWIAGFALAGLVGFLVTPLWMALMRFRGAAKVDIADSSARISPSICWLCRSTRTLSRLSSLSFVSRLCCG